MKRRLAGMIGAAVLATVGTTQIAAAAPDPQEVLQARSFAELLQPIPDATVLLAAAEAASARDLRRGRTARAWTGGCSPNTTIIITIITTGGGIITTITTITIYYY